MMRCLVWRVRDATPSLSLNQRSLGVPMGALKVPRPLPLDFLTTRFPHYLLYRKSVMR